MTPVQASTIPLFLNYKDCIVQAVTGSGKTLAFLVPILQILHRKIAQDEKPLAKNRIYALVLAPTRELATQINTVLAQLLDLYLEMVAGADSIKKEASKSTKRNAGAVISSGLLIGGTSVREDIDSFSKSGAHILIATPGRVQDLFSAHPSLFNVRELEVLVMDEADRLLDLGFERQLMSILAMLPKQRRTCLFSATMSEGLARIVKAGLRNPVKVSVKVQVQTTTTTSTLAADNSETGPQKPQSSTIVLTEQSIPESLSVEYLLCSPLEKLAHLLALFTRYPEQKYIIYFSNGASVDFYFKLLPLLPECSQMSFHSLHGKMVPKRRTATYSSFSSAPSSHVLLCTDVAARGLDLPDIDMVVQWDAPQDPKVFAHRAGRAGRAGRKGRALIFLAGNEETYIDFLKVRKVPIKEYIGGSGVGEEEGGMMIEKRAVELGDMVRKICTLDRDVMEKSIKAFVSWIRSYNEHQASFIFQLKQVDMVSVCLSFGLLTLPKVPELRSLDLTSFTPATDISVDGIAYKDKTRERQRQQNLHKLRENKEKGLPIKSGKKRPPPQTVSWSVQKKVKENRVERQEKRVKRRAAVARKRDDEAAAAGASIAKPLDWKDRMLGKTKQ